MTTFSESTLQSVERKNVISKGKTELIAEINNLLDEIEKKQVSIGLKSDKSKSKNLGQYFTNLEISKILSHQISGDFKKSTISIIDAGAGIGILGISSIKRLIEVTDMKDFHISSVELDTNLIPMLTESFRKLNLILIKYGYSLSSSIFNIDFVTGRNHFTNKQFDIAILNPPYFKINSESIYFNRTNDLFKGNPNIYTQFIAVCLSQLNKDGQLIVISPRSFTNGLYFKGFREFLFSRYAISHIHSFISRDSLFDKVLQEVVIYKIISRKNYNGSTEIVISTSEKENEVKFEKKIPESILVNINSINKFIHIPENSSDLKILDFMDSFQSSFNELGYFISTGEVVQFRTKDFIMSKKGKQTIPLFKSQDVNPTLQEISKTTENHFLLKSESQKHTIPAKNYLLLRRFSSKDDKKRLIASKILELNFSTSIGLDNHLNYIGLNKKGNGLPLDELNGLYVLLNSSLYERYFRCISGNTQVNATEVREMRFPNRDIIKAIGKEYIRLNTKKFNQDKIDNIVFELLKVPNNISL